jgi:DNA modification methylase
MTCRIINADVMDGLAQLADESVHCVVTSPPYWGLRDYGAEGQIGLEPTLAEHIAKLVEVFREVRRVLRNDGVMWLNYGDAYANDAKWGGSTSGKHVEALHGDTGIGQNKRVTGFKPKELMLMPERLAIALSDDGWTIRSRVIWHKANPMPESVTDRPTKSHEHIWLMSKAPRYFYDAEAIKEDASENSHGALNGDPGAKARHTGNHSGPLGLVPANGTRNARDVWTIATSPFAEAHFATFPPDLAERCIKAGCPKGGTVLDPFGGSGTTGLVADRLQRNAVLVELNPEYAAMAKRRLTNDAPLFAEVAL